jgi:excinuclease UvrABC ATPase subunit
LSIKQGNSGIKEMIIAQGTPAEVAKCKESHTGQYLKKMGV